MWTEQRKNYGLKFDDNNFNFVRFEMTRDWTNAGSFCKILNSSKIINKKDENWIVFLISGDGETTDECVDFSHNCTQKIT